MWVSGSNKRFETYSLNKDFQMSPKNAGVQITPDSDRSYVSPQPLLNNTPTSIFQLIKALWAEKFLQVCFFFFFSFPSCKSMTFQHQHSLLQNIRAVRTRAQCGKFCILTGKTKPSIPSHAMGICAPHTARVFGFLSFLNPREKFWIPFQWMKVPGPFHSETCSFL